MIVKRFVIGLLITLFLPAPRGSDLSVFLNLPVVLFNIFETRQVETVGVVSTVDRTAEKTRCNVALQSDCPVDLFDGLLEKEIENELEEESSGSEMNSKRIADSKCFVIPYLFSFLQIQQFVTEKSKAILLSHLIVPEQLSSLICVIRC